MKKSSRCFFIHEPISFSALPYIGAVSIWFTPCCSSMPSIRSASAWSALHNAYAPNIRRLLACPVPPNNCLVIIWRTLSYMVPRHCGRRECPEAHRKPALQAEGEAFRPGESPTVSRIPDEQEGRRQKQEGLPREMAAGSCTLRMVVP